jgi:opacity protein-like surface antigen
MHDIRRTRTGLVGGSLAAACLTLMLVSVCQAADPFRPYSREGRGEFFVGGQIITADNTNYNTINGPVSVSMDTAGLGGFGLGYHFDDYFCARAEFMFGGTTFHASGPGVAITPYSFGISNSALISTGRFNLDWNILKQRLTPFVTAGIGYQYISVDMPFAPVQGGYWYPGYGYYQTYDETDFSWNVGGGIRYDVNNRFFLRAEADYNGLQYSGANSTTSQLRATLGLGFMY